MAAEFYILSLKHTQRAHRVLTWWRPKNADYCFRLELAGRYTAGQVAAEPDYYDNGHSTRAVPCEVVEALAINVRTVRTRFIDPTEHDASNRVVEYRHLRALSRNHRAQLVNPGRPARS